MTQTNTPMVDNGVNVEALRGARQALTNAPEAAQLTSHLPAPHAMLRHEFEPVHDTVHLSPRPAGHVTPLRHACTVLHATSQFQPAGQTTALLQLVDAQSMWQVCEPLSQLVHCVGQFPGGPSIDESATGPSPFGASTVPPGTTQ